MPLSFPGIKRPIKLRSALLILLFIMLSHTLTGTGARRDPDSGEIRLLHLGKVWPLPRHPGPIFSAEPRISWNPVPSYFTPDCVCHHATTYGEREVRELRTKLPRSKDDLVGKYDVVLIDAMFALDMPPHLSRWIVEGVLEDGLGFMMVDDEVTFAGRGLAPSWYITPVGDILPVDDTPGYFGWNQRFQIIPVDTDHPLVSGLDFEGIWLEANNRPIPRVGSTVIAEMSPGNPWNTGKPAMVSWEIGAGRSLAYIHRWHSGSGNFYSWKYHADFICNTIYFAACEGIPDDLELVHDLREMMAEVETERMVLVSTMDLADEFGANLENVNGELSEIHTAKREADRLYLDQELEASMGRLTEISSDLKSLVDRTLKLKDGAMMWIFAIQWLAVTGTTMVAGFVIWSLMIRRRLYSEVGTTRYPG